MTDPNDYIQDWTEREYEYEELKKKIEYDEDLEEDVYDR